MSRSTRQKRKARRTVVRAKADCPTRRSALRSLRLAGIYRGELIRPHHSGTYWRWEVRS